MTIPRDFQFSQASLQDFGDCPKRFQLRYIEGLRWPAAEAEPIEEHERRMALGTDFHRMAQRHIVGLPEEQIAQSIEDDQLLDWWQNLRTYRPVVSYGGDAESAVVRSEVVLQGRMAGYRLVAKIDALIANPGKALVILDWKTSTRRPSDHDLRARLQTRVYRALAVQAGGYLNGKQSVDPEMVEMIYWFPQFPGSPARLPYSQPQYEADVRYLARLISRIAEMENNEFVLTDDEDKCEYCPYRSYCGRGEEAGDLVDAQLDWEPIGGLDDLALDFEQIGEIAF